jgi:hypothetical protein
LRCVELGYDRFEDFIDDGGKDSFVVVGSEFSVAASQRALEHSSGARVARFASGRVGQGLRALPVGQAIGDEGT